ncbi:MAG TPA: glycosyltransferase family 1 protein [Chitinophagales bacterium]
MRRKIAVNTRFLLHGKIEGIGLFTQEILREMVLAHPEIDFYFLFDRSFHQSFIFAENVKPVVLFPQARHPFLWYWWFEISVKNWLAKNKPDVFLSTDGYCVLNTNTPQVLVVHDLAFEHFSDHVPKLVLKYYKYFVPKFIAKAEKVVAVSEVTKQDIVSHYGTNPDKIEVVYNATINNYKPLNDVEKTAIKAEFSNDESYFVYVGSIHPRKNIRNLLLAFDEFKQQTSAKTKLLLVGRMMFLNDDVETTLNKLKHRNDIVFLGHQPSEKVAQIVGSALAMCYVSLFEGFGIPIIEAQQAGTAVITSSVSSMPEVAGNSALLVNPESVNEIASVMQKINADVALRNDLIQKGFENIKRFGWKLSAEKLFKLL